MASGPGSSAGPGWRRATQQGQPVRVVGTDTDFTARKDSEARLSALLRAIPDLIFRSASTARSSTAVQDPRADVAAAEVFLGKNIRTPDAPAFVDVTLAHVERVVREGTLASTTTSWSRRAEGCSSTKRACRAAVRTKRSASSATSPSAGWWRSGQAQLIQAEKLASLGQLAAGIAHEINNPVSYVTSNLKTLDH